AAGGVEALLGLLPRLPASFPATVAVTLHLSSGSRTTMPELISRRGGLPAVAARNNELMRRGRIYFAPPDVHFELGAGASPRAILRAGPRENRARPAIDPLFRTAAHAFGPRVIGVVLSGALDDGTAGLVSIKPRGGLAVVQSPE